MVNLLRFLLREELLFDTIVAQEDKIETLKRSSGLFHYCAAPLLFHPDWRRKRSSTASESTVVHADEPSTEEKIEETKEGKSSSRQKQSESEFRRCNMYMIKNTNDKNCTTGKC